MALNFEHHTLYFIDKRRLSAVSEARFMKLITLNISR